MAGSGTLRDAFLEELRDTYDAERQITKALPKMAKATSSEELRAAFEMHLEETREQVARLEEVFGMLDQKVRGKHCEGVAGIIEEARSAMQEDMAPATLDALLIAAAQRVEHYEIAAYGTLAAWAEALGQSEVVDLLRQTLDEEKETDEKLTTLGTGGINQRAAEGSDEEEEAMERAPRRAAAGGRKAAKKTAAKSAGRAGARKTTRRR